jgi:hypothetical protein
VSQELIHSSDFKERHRTAKKYFSRARILTFPIIVLILVQKSAKSMQLVLNEFLKKMKLPLVTSSAFSQARAHLSHQAFIELNQEAIVKVSYSDGEYERYKGFRVLGIDGSKIYLPAEEKIIAEFGGTVQNQHSADIQPFGLASVMYDVLNRIAIDSQLAPAKAYEVDLARQHLAHSQADDLLLFDRNYPSYLFLATVYTEQRNFVMRCSRASFKPVRVMFEGVGPDSQLVTLKVPSAQSQQVKQLNLPREITVRLVRVWLASGEMEILITSLLDESRYPTAEFGQLYFLRWGSETFYDLLKTRLQLENFSGKTVEAVKQDFYATIYISGLETLLTGQAQSRLHDRSAANKYPQQVNQAVSFNTIKNHIIDLLYTEPDEDLLLDKLTQLFLMKPTAVRKNRSVPRPKFSPSKRLQFHKRFKKICF